MAANKKPHAGPGRPSKRPQDIKSRQIHVPVTDELYERFRARAAAQGKPLATWLRDLALLADAVGENPAAILRAMLVDPAGERTTFVRKGSRREPVLPITESIETFPSKRSHRGRAAAT
jgi:hypothetical protein